MARNIKTESKSTELSTASIRTGNSVEEIKQAFTDNLNLVQGKFPPIATSNDYYMALAYTVRDRLMDFWTCTARTYLEQASRTVCYLSAEFLLGPQMENNIYNLGIYNNTKQAMQELGLNLDDLISQEAEPGLGNGGLGRLAACFLDSLATLNIPTIGYGIRYEFGIFSQEIRDGWQIENTDKWLRYGNPWEIARPEINFDIKLGGHTESYLDEEGNYHVRWVPYNVIKSVAYDIPIIGYQANTANFLRLWKAEASESFDFQAFNVGDYYGAVHEKISSENITKVLYPNDEPLVGKKLRLQQQYFFVSSSLQDMIRIYKQRVKDLEKFHEKYTIQLNDTHPAIGIAELMRLLIDEHHIGWDKAWEITQKTFSYTNHTLMPEALEKWPYGLFANLLPRHLEIILEINARFLADIQKRYPHDVERLRRMSIIDEAGERYIRMANLACIGSHAINGVSKLHSELVKKELLHDFYDIWPDKFTNVTNGVTPRRFLVVSNPSLADLINETIGTNWIKNLEQLRGLEKFTNDSGFCEKWRQIKLANKTTLATIIRRVTAVNLDPNSLFDIQAKRIHEYKRQHLNILHVIALYQSIINNPNRSITPRTVIFAGKAAPGYYTAKLIIKLINSVANVINKDPRVKDLLKVVFLPNYNVKHAERIYPAAELSEQISTAGTEASGTGNMKFALNGALTIGTLDGANIEIREAVGADNFFLFGLTTPEVLAIRKGYYNPQEVINNTPELHAAIEMVLSGVFSNGDRELFRPLINVLTPHDEFLICADFKAYADCQQQVGLAYRNKNDWTKMSVLNVARIGEFSSDRAIREYCENIWNVKPVKIDTSSG